MSIPKGDEVQAQAQSAGGAPSPMGEPCPGDVPKEGSRDIQKRGKIISVPYDWCKSTESPIPYRIWAWQSSASNLANSVRQTDCRSHVLGSIVNECYGDDPGKGGGIHSGTYEAECTPMTASPTVRAENRPMVRYLDKWHMNKGNTWGCLHNAEDLGRYNAPKVQTIDAKLSQNTTNTSNDAGPMPIEAGQQYALVDENHQYLAPIDPLDPGSTLSEPPGTTPKEHQLHKMEHGLGLALGLAFAYYYYEHLRVSQKEEGKCPCIVGKYQDVKPKCAAAGCSGQAHHIVADKYLRTGTRPASGVVDPNRINNMPSLDDGPSICLNGNAGDEDSDHNIAHQNDALIQNLGDQSNPKGTLPIGTIRWLSVSAAKAAAPPDEACQSEIDKEAGIDKYGGNSAALVRATNNPPAADSPAMNYFRPKAPIQK